MKAVRARPLDRPGQFLELGGERLEFGGKRLGVERGHVGAGVEQGVEHHRDARQDRFLDSLERLVQPGLLFAHGHGRQYGANAVKVW